MVEHFHLYSIAGWEVYSFQIIIASLGLVVFGYLNIKRTGLSGKLQFGFAIIMVSSVVVLTLLIDIELTAGLANMKPYFPTNTTTFAAIISIVAIAPWAYVGFDVVPQAAEEFDFPAKKAFTLIILAILCAALIYSFMIIATSMASPWESVVDANHLWGTGFVVQALLSIGGLVILVVTLSMGIFTGLNGFVLASSRLLFAMSRAKIIPEAFGNYIQSIILPMSLSSLQYAYLH